MQPNIERLTKLAEHLIKGVLDRPYEELMESLRRDDNSSGHYSCFPFVFNELPYLFKEWEH